MDSVSETEHSNLKMAVDIFYLLIGTSGALYKMKLIHRLGLLTISFLDFKINLINVEKITEF